MDPTLRDQLLAVTEQALKNDDWPAVEQIWQPYIAEGDLEAHYQLAYHYLWYTPVDDDATRDRMYNLLRYAASKDHADSVWFMADRLDDVDPEQSPVYAREILRAGHLGSKHAQRALGVAYATGDGTGPQDLTEAIDWYRRAAEQGEPTSQYDLGFMLLLGEGEPRKVDEGLQWLERAANAGGWSAMRLLVDCYENGYCEVPKNPPKPPTGASSRKNTNTKTCRALRAAIGSSAISIRIPLKRSQTLMASSATAAGIR
ncbi:MAG: sel1 repeat family protein [Bryobacterales bacterium]|nr:sel1 repeat family protein [Bryobacterales bacterium]